MAKRRPFSEEKPLEEIQEQEDIRTEETPEIEKKIVMTTPRLLNVRSLPEAMTDNVVEVVEEGTILTVSEITGNPEWYRVHNENAADTYVMKSLVKEVE